VDPKHISRMVTALKPALKSTERAHTILETFWQDKIAIIWTIEHVYRAANELGVAVNRTEAIESTIVNTVYVGVI
jgi:hypothetical protein